MTSHWEALKWLQGAGFPISPDNSLQESFAEAVEAARQWMGRRQVLGYEVDGSVLKIDDLVIRKALGSIGGDPRWAVAWKFPAQEAVAKLLGIEMSLGR